MYGRFIHLQSVDSLLSTVSRHSCAIAKPTSRRTLLASNYSHPLSLEIGFYCENCSTTWLTDARNLKLATKESQEVFKDDHAGRSQAEWARAHSS
jgi:hypothetical protein